MAKLHSALLNAELHNPKGITSNSTASIMELNQAQSAISSSADFVPTTTAIYDLGSATLPWKEIFVTTSSINFVNPAGTIIQQIKATPAGITFTSGSGAVANVSGSIISGSALHIQGNAKVTGNLTLGGQITLGDADTDDVIFEAEVSSSIIPDADDTYDLGSSGKQWKDIYINGIGYIDSLGTDADPVTAYINAGEIDGAVIGGESAAAATITTLNITSMGSGWTNASNTVADLGTITTVDINGGTVDGTTIGASSHTTIKGTTIDATTDFTIGTTVITDDSIVMTPTTDDTATIAASTNGALTITTVDTAAAAANITITADGTVDIDSAGLMTLDSGGAINLEPAGGSAVLIDGNASFDGDQLTGLASVTSTAFLGTLDGVVGGNTAAAGTFTNLTVTTDVNIDDSSGDGAIDGVIIGASTAAAATFTSMNTTGLTTIGDASGDTLTINAATINPTNIAAGTDNTVVVYNGSTLVTDEIDSKVWAGNLVDTDGSGANNELVTWSDSDSIIGEGNLTFDGSTLTVKGAITGSSVRASDIKVGVTAANEIDTDQGNLILDSAGGTVQVTDILDVDGDITLETQATDIDLIDNNASALSFDAAGKAGILEIDTQNGAEKVKMSGAVDVEGNITGATISGSSIDGTAIRHNTTTGLHSLVLNEDLTVSDGTAVIITSADQTNTITLNEGFTIGGGNTGTLTYSGASKTLTVEDTSTVDQDLTKDADVQFNSLTLDGDLTAQRLIVSSSVTNVTQSFSSGSTIFGDSIDDTHQVTGSLQVSGAAEVKGNLTVETDSTYTLGGAAKAWSTVYADNIDLDGQGRIDLDDDQDTSIRASSDDVIRIEIAGADEIEIDGSSIRPVTSDGSALGDTDQMWADLFLASGGVVNFNNGNMTLSHAAGILDVAGGIFRVAGLITGSTDLVVGDISNTKTYISASGGNLKVSHDIFAQDYSGSTAAFGSTITSEGTISGSSVYGTTIGQNRTDGLKTITIEANSTVNQDLTTDAAPRFETIELGAASDTTIARSGAGVLTVEGNRIFHVGGTDVPVADGGTGASTLNNLITLGTHTTGNYVATITGGTGITSTGATSGETIAHSLSVDASQTQITAVGTIATGVWNGTPITNAYIGDDEINSEHYAADSIDAEHYAAGSVDADAIGNDVVNSQHYAAASIDNEHLADNAVNSAELAAGSVDDGHLSDGVATGLAGTGMTATSGVLNVIGGTGITANANEITTTDGDIVHDNLSGFVANEHIDHSGVTLTAGTGLNGGGTIAASRTFTVDAAQTVITSIYATDLIMGEDDETNIDFGTVNQISFNTNDAEDFRMVAGGTFHANADVVAFSSTVASDMNLKKNITDMKYGLDTIMQLRGVEYDWKREDMGHDLGVLAQEVEKVIPELVKEHEGLNGRGKFKSVDYNKLVPILIESIKELKTEVDSLKVLTEVKELKS